MATAVGQLVLRVFYGLNVVGAGVNGIKLLRGRPADFGAAISPPLAGSVVGGMWLSASITSLAGLVAPVEFSPILLFQFIHKTIYFFAATLPALRRNKPADRPAIKMGLIFAPYTFLLPFFLPWDHLLGPLLGRA